MEAPNNAGLGVLIRHFHIGAANEQLGLANEGLNLLPEPGLALTVLEALVIQDPFDGFLLGNGNVLLDVLLGALEHEQIAHQALVRRHEHKQFVRLVRRGCTEHLLVVGMLVERADDIDRELVFTPMQTIIQFARIGVVLPLVLGGTSVIADLALLDDVVENDLFQFVRNVR